MLDQLSTLLFYVLGLLYPAYRTHAVLKDRRFTQYTRYMTYWTVIGFLLTLEKLIDVCLQYLPLYAEMKLLFVLWLFFPDGKGAQFVLDGVIEPLTIKIYAALRQRSAHWMHMVRDGFVSVVGNALLVNSVVGTVQRYLTSMAEARGGDRDDAREREPTTITEDTPARPMRTLVTPAPETTKPDTPRQARPTPARPSQVRPKPISIDEPEASSRATPRTTQPVIGTRPTRPTAPLATPGTQRPTRAHRPQPNPVSTVYGTLRRKPASSSVGRASLYGTVREPIKAASPAVTRYRTRYQDRMSATKSDESKQ